MNVLNVGLKFIDSEVDVVEFGSVVMETDEIDMRSVGFDSVHELVEPIVGHKPGVFWSGTSYSQTGGDDGGPCGGSVGVVSGWCADVWFVVCEDGFVVRFDNKIEGFGGCLAEIPDLGNKLYVFWDGKGPFCERLLGLWPPGVSPHGTDIFYFGVDVYGGPDSCSFFACRGITLVDLQSAASSTSRGSTCIPR